MARGAVATLLPLSTQVEMPQLWPVYHGSTPESLAALTRLLWIQSVASCSVVSCFLGNWKTV